jgi:hypothetical protein
MKRLEKLAKKGLFVNEILPLRWPAFNRRTDSQERY